MARAVICRHALRADVEHAPGAVAITWDPDDPDLAVVGHQQADWTALRLASYEVDVVLTSPHRRTLETAEHIGDTTGAPVRLIPSLCEILRADWYGVDYTFSGGLTLATCPSGASTYPEMTKAMTLLRLKRLVAWMEKEYGGASVVAVTHGGVILDLVREFIPDAPATPFPPSAYSHVVRLGREYHLLEHGAISYPVELASEEHFGDDGPDPRQK